MNTFFVLQHECSRQEEFKETSSPSCEESCNQKEDFENLQRYIKTLCGENVLYIFKNDESPMAQPTFQRRINIEITLLKMKQNPISDFQCYTTLTQHWRLTLKQRWNNVVQRWYNVICKMLPRRLNVS